jgi:hypothetical protein
MKKFTPLLAFALIVLILALIVAACGSGNGNKKGGISGGQWLPSNIRSTEQSANATATYGAEVLQIQLTAIAEKQSLTGGEP